MAGRNNNASILRQQRNQLKKELGDFIVVMGVEAKNHFQKSFSDGGFTDRTLERWEARKSNRNNRGRAILVKTGNLRRSIRVVSRTLQSITIGSDLIYADVHNEGLRVRGHKMPKRQFVGNSYKLNMLLQKKLNLIFKRIFTR